MSQAVAPLHILGGLIVMFTVSGAQPLCTSTWKRPPSLINCAWPAAAIARNATVIRKCLGILNLGKPNDLFVVRSVHGLLSPNTTSVHKAKYDSGWYHSGFQLLQDGFQGLFLLASSDHIAENQLAAGNLVGSNYYGVRDGALVGIIELLFQPCLVGIDLGADTGLPQR